MKNSRRLTLLLTILIGLPAFFLGRIIWPDSAEMPMLTGMQTGFFGFLALTQSLLLGFGVAFLVASFKFIRGMDNSLRGRSWLGAASLIWLMISWWPHDNLHRTNGMNVWGLIAIDYGFHLTLIIATLVLAYVFLSFARELPSAR